MQNNMHRNPAAGTGKVYWFSLRQMILSKGWLGSTIIIALLLLLGIPAILLGISKLADDDGDDDDETPVRQVFVVDETAGEADYNALNDYFGESYTFTNCTSMDTAISESVGMNDAVILRVTKPAETYSLTVYLTQVTEVTRSKASSFGETVSDAFPAILMQKAQLTPEGVALLSLPVTSETAALSEDAEEESDDEDGFGEVLDVFVPFMMVMLIYMMVILYGQSMANSVMLEKTSKLMETILTAVHPFALMAGKLLATATAAVIQILIWLASLTGGIVGGAMLAIRVISGSGSSAAEMISSSGAADMAQEMGTAEMITDITGRITEMISIPGILVSIVFVALGFLLYLSLASVSGALASKQEELNKTNVIYTLVLVGSMLLCIMPSSSAAEAAAAGADVSIVSDALWLKLFPFTSILLMPGKLILGKASVGVTCASAACLIAGVLLLVAAAAVIYKLLVLYRGAVPTPKALLTMLRENRKPKGKTENPEGGN